MPTIVIASPKGGAGKSTTAVILGTEPAPAGAKVTMLDCDPNGSLSLWANRSGLPPRITVESGIFEGDIVRTIKSRDMDGSIVVVDLEGVASRLVSRAISQADLVITPMRAIRSRQHTGIERSLRDQGIDVIEPDLTERAAYSALFEFGGDFATLPPRGNMEATHENAGAFARAVFERLTAKKAAA